MSEEDINFAAFRKAPQSFIATVRLIKAKIMKPKLVLPLGVDYDETPRLQEADDYGLMVGTRKSGKLLIGQSTGAATGGGNAVALIKPEADEIDDIWEIDNISVNHDAATNKSLNMYRTDGTNSVIMTYNSGIVVELMTTIPFYPTAYDVDLSLYVVLGSGPLTVSKNVWLLFDLTTPGDGKILTVDYTYRPIRK